jgi:hypothetical protein
MPLCSIVKALKVQHVKTFYVAIEIGYISPKAKLVWLHLNPIL